MAVMALIAAIAAIYGSVLGCRVTCCNGTATGVCIKCVFIDVFTAAHPAYAGTEGCYEMLVFFLFFYLMRNL